MSKDNSYEIFNYGKKRDNLLDTLKKIKEHATEVGLTEVAKVIEGNLKKEKGFQVAVIGEFKRGKSTLINALLGENVLPADVIPCTATVNRISYGIKPSVQIIYKQIEEEYRKPEVINFNELNDYVTKLTADSADKAADIEEALIEYNIEYLRHGVDIIDTPGLNDASDMTEVTIGLMNKAHAAIMVISADAPFGQSEQEFLEDIAEKNIGRVLFVVNRIDVIDEDDRERLVDAIENRIISAVKTTAERKYKDNETEKQNHINRFGDPKLFPISAKKALKGKLNNDATHIEESNFNEFETALKKFLTKDSGSVIISSLAFCIKHNAEKVLGQMGIIEDALKADQGKFESVYQSSMDTLSELSQKYNEEISLIDKSAEKTKSYSKGILDTVNEEIVRIITRTVDEESLQHLEVRGKAVEKTQRKLGEKIEEAVRGYLRTTLKNIQYSIEQELEKEANRLKTFTEEVTTSLTKIELDFKRLNTDHDKSNEVADVAWSAGIGAMAAPMLGGIYTGYREAGGKGMAVGGVSGAAAAVGVAYVGIAMGITLASPLILPLALTCSVAAALAGKWATRKLFGADKVSEFKENYKTENIELISTEFMKNKPKIEGETYKAIDENYKRFKDLISNEIGKNIGQTKNTIEELSIKKARSEAERDLELTKLSDIREFMISSRSYAITTIDELQKIEGV